MSSPPKISQNDSGNALLVRMSSPRTRHLQSRTEEIIDELSFWSILVWECKRAQRSGKLFALMLLDASEFSAKSADSKRIPRFLLAWIRETDLLGWYENGTVLGLIFTDIDPKNAPTVGDTLRSRVETGLEGKLGIEGARRAVLSIELFPDSADSCSSKPKTFVNRKFYTDNVGPTSRGTTSLALKRAIDVVGSAVLLVLLSPLFAVIAAAIKLTSTGEVLFRQERLGQNGIPFQFLKFRSMYVNNSPDIHREFVTDFIKGKSEAAEQPDPAGNGKVYKIAVDPRVTPIGRFLRKSSLDELPQLWNVLKGQMSLVGPRPPLRYEFHLYAPWHRRRILEAKPGVTGLWQVNGRSRTCFDDMVRLDLRYARSWSLWLDIVILLLTPFAVFSGDGAY